MEDFCAVCAGELNFTAYGPCGHKETCSKCVIRLRFVLNDKRCVICQQESPAVFVTRFNGDYTRRLSDQEFAELTVRRTTPRHIHTHTPRRPPRPARPPAPATSTTSLRPPPFSTMSRIIARCARSAATPTPSSPPTTRPNSFTACAISGQPSKPKACTFAGAV